MAPKFDVYAHVADTIIAEIEAGTPPWRKPWTGSASGVALPTRHKGEEYRGINILMLWVMAAKHRYVSSRWMTYKQAQELTSADPVGSGAPPKHKRVLGVPSFSTLHAYDLPVNARTKCMCFRTAQ